MEMAFPPTLLVLPLDCQASKRLFLQRKVHFPLPSSLGLRQDLLPVILVIGRIRMVLGPRDIMVDPDPDPLTAVGVPETHRVLDVIVVVMGVTLLQVVDAMIETVTAEAEVTTGNAVLMVVVAAAPALPMNSHTLRDIWSTIHHYRPTISRCLAEHSSSVE